MKQPVLFYAPDADSTTPGVITSGAAFVPSSRGYKAAPGAQNTVLLPLGTNLVPYSVYSDAEYTEATLLPSITYTRTGPKTYFDKDGILRTAADNEWPLEYDPVTLEPLGRSVWEARTNYIRNNTMQGAAAGTPGTVPTNWQNAQTQNGLTREIVGVGTEDGIDYIDIRWSGVTTAAGGITIAMPENTTVVPAAQGQTWTGSLYARLVGGSLNNVDQLSLLTVGRTGAGGFVESGTQNMLGITSAPLSEQRFSATRTMANAGIEYVTTQVFMAHASGVAIDITLRIGLLQLERGATASPAIPTTGSAVTRAADVASIPLGDWFNTEEGTFLSLGGTTNDGAVRYLSVRGGTSNSYIEVRKSSTESPQIVVSEGGVVQAQPFVPSVIVPTDGTPVLIAAAYKESDFAISANGSAVATATSGSLPSGLDRMFIGSNGSVGFPNGHIRSLIYYPHRLSNAELPYLPNAYNGTADPTQYLDREIWFIDRKSAENKVFVEFELSAAFDVAGVLLPRRQCIQNVCTWAYRSAECGYTGGPVADRNDEPVTDLADDVCGKRLSSCRLRFGQYAPLPFGGFPGAGLVR